MHDMHAAVLIAAGVIVTAYCIGLIVAAWWVPSMQRLAPFRPRWQHGIRTGRWGMTAQAVYLQCMVSMVASKAAHLDWAFKTAFAGFCMSGAVAFLIWACDAAGDERPRN